MWLISRTSRFQISTYSGKPKRARLNSGKANHTTFSSTKNSVRKSSNKVNVSTSNSEECAVNQPCPKCNRVNSFLIVPGNYNVKWVKKRKYCD